MWNKEPAMNIPNTAARDADIAKKRRLGEAKLVEFLHGWFEAGQAPIHASTLVDDVETFEEVVAQFLASRS